MLIWKIYIALIIEKIGFIYCVFVWMLKCGFVYMCIAGGEALSICVFVKIHKYLMIFFYICLILNKIILLVKK